MSTDPPDEPEVRLREPAAREPRLIVSLDDPPASPEPPPVPAPAPDRLTVTLDAPPAMAAAAGRIVDLSQIEPSRAPALVSLRRRPSVPSGGVMRIGSAEDCDVVISHPVISPVHAELRNTARGPLVRDVSHGASKLVVNGRFVNDSYLQDGDRVGIGPARFVVEERKLIPIPALQEAPLLTASGVSVVAGRRSILAPTWLAVRPGELVAMIGESGAGKSTLLKVLAGVHRPATGGVLVGDEPLAMRRTEIGYVPQDEIVHPSLTVREGLRYAARLRLPQDATARARREAVDQVLKEMGLTAHAKTRIGALSGGQRKRVGVATELVSRPRILFLDEPTTGLDPGLESRMMRLFRQLADGGRAVILVTHAVQNLALCDRLVVMARGGQVAFSGPPDGARQFFGVERLEELYEVLDHAPEGAWHSRFVQTPDAAEWGSLPPVPLSHAAPTVKAAGSVARQLFTLVSRYVRLFLRDRRTLLTTFIQVPVFALAISLLFDGHVFDRTPPGTNPGPGNVHAAQSGQMLFLLVTIAFWFGAIASAREIVKERAVVARELDVGVRAASYVASKFAVLVVVVTLQIVALAAIVLSIRPMHEASGAYVSVAALMVLVGCTAIALGLWVSVSASSEDQAMSFMPLLLVPQLLFGGAVVSLHQMGSVMQVVARLAPVSWAYAGAGDAIGLKERGSPDPTFAANYGPSFFRLPPAVAAVVLVAMILGLGWLVGQRVRALRSRG